MIDLNQNPHGPAPTSARAAIHSLWRLGLAPEDFQPTCADLAALTNPLD